MTVANSVKLSSDSTKFYQLFSVLSVCYLCISCGNFLGYTSTALPSMEEDKESFEELTKHDKSWIGSLGPLGALFGSTLVLIPLRFFGPRRTISFFGCPAMLCSWSFIGFADDIIMIFVGRFLGGLGTGVIIPCSSLFVVDIASVELRGKLGILPQFLMIFGILISYVLGSFLSWRILALACCTLAGPSILLLVLAPDTPSWLVSKDRCDDAYEILEKLLGSHAASARLRDVRDTWDLSQQRKESQMVGVRKQRLNTGMIKASAVALGVLSFQQLTGINGVTFYALSIFQQSAGESSSLNPHIPSIILATTQLIASFTSTLIVERAGRRILLLISTFMISIAGSILGIYFYCGTGYPFLSWVPLAALIMYTFGFAIGLGPITWLIVSEMLPEEIRHIMNPLGIAYSWFCVFLVTKSFPLLRHEINIYGIFWMYAGIAFIGLIFVALFVPETKGKSIREIREYFNSSVVSRKTSATASTITSDVETGYIEDGEEDADADADATKCLTESA
ncbi:Facilitated trehalose transporter Tret1 [Orchesella cincta]|uniref:Facilitated trehalose transporter Tret1 n=1 Tax=Orchesella cincta TaxID=48709 RepID=A0A1D2MN62_ORCCI|nr:Facilitated trehalose transporter Tret1 [Orchesella cincta]